MSQFTNMMTLHGFRRVESDGAGPRYFRQTDWACYCALRGDPRDFWLALTDMLANYVERCNGGDHMGYVLIELSIY